MNLLADASLPSTIVLSAWQNFYELVGSSGGALIGLQFVVMALISGSRSLADIRSINAFGTPTVVHFAGALLIAAVMCAPWPSLSAASVALVVCGSGGFGYAILVFRRARRQTVYKPALEDWLWYVIVPCGIYVALTVAAFFLTTATQAALFVIGGAALGLLFDGIRNAWDTVTYIVAGPHRDASKSE